MKVHLLGTGSADGWPNPFCRCASCETVRGTPDARGQNCALVDDVLLLDCGADGPRLAARLGVPLAGVRHVLLTHAHADHTYPPAFEWLGWAGHGAVDLIGPPTALERVSGWTDLVVPVPALPGERLKVGDYEVRPVRANHEADAVLYDITGDARLLYATDTAALPDATVDALAGRAFDLVLLELTFGTDVGGSDGHLDFASFPATLARLRRAGAIVDATRVVAVHLSHRNPPPAELSAQLARWGAELHRDGAALRIGDATPEPVRPHRTVVIGGARSGKSTWAASALAAEPSVAFVATGAGDDDPDWVARVAAHRAARPPTWTTIETDDIAGHLDADRAVLVDDLGNWLARAIDAAGAWDDPARMGAVHARADALLSAWSATRSRVVLVTNEVGQGVHPATRAGRVFRDELGRLNARLAAASEEVVALTAGIPRWVRSAS